MTSRTWVLGLAGCALLVGCESRAYKELHQQKIALEIEHRRVLEQMNEVWYQSLKARFPLLLRIEPGKQMELTGWRYIQSIKLQKEDHYNDKWKATFNYLATQNDTSPDFHLYLFDERGLNVARYHVVHGVITNKMSLKAGEQKSETINKIDIDPNDTPCFFWIRFVN